jgi:hypothetical protein
MRSVHTLHYQIHLLVTVVVQVGGIELLGRGAVDLLKTVGVPGQHWITPKRWIL